MERHFETEAARRVCVELRLVDSGVVPDLVGLTRSRRIAQFRQLSKQGDPRFQPTHPAIRPARCWRLVQPE